MSKALDHRTACMVRTAPDLAPGCPSHIPATRHSTARPCECPPARLARLCGVRTGGRAGRRDALCCCLLPVLLRRAASVLLPAREEVRPCRERQGKSAPRRAQGEQGGGQAGREAQATREQGGGTGTGRGSNTARHTCRGGKGQATGRAPRGARRGTQGHARTRLRPSHPRPLPLCASVGCRSPLPPPPPAVPPTGGGGQAEPVGWGQVGGGGDAPGAKGRGGSEGDGARAVKARPSLCVEALCRPRLPHCTSSRHPTGDPLPPAPPAPPHPAPPPWACVRPSALQALQRARPPGPAPWARGRRERERFRAPPPPRARTRSRPSQRRPVSLPAPRHPSPPLPFPHPRQEQDQGEGVGRSSCAAAFEQRRQRRQQQQPEQSMRAARESRDRGMRARGSLAQGREIAVLYPRARTRTHAAPECRRGLRARARTVARGASIDTHPPPVLPPRPHALARQGPGHARSFARPAFTRRRAVCLAGGRGRETPGSGGRWRSLEQWRTRGRWQPREHG
jgi:hypothetical protein